MSKLLKNVNTNVTVEFKGIDKDFSSNKRTPRIFYWVTSSWVVYNSFFILKISLQKSFQKYNWF
jgi:hypothetical protein